MAEEPILNMSGELKLKTRYYKTARTLTILSEAYEAGSEEVSEMELEYLPRFVDEDHGVLLSDTSTFEEVTPKQMADLLYEAGSDPGFFQLDDDGKPND